MSDRRPTEVWPKYRCLKMDGYFLLTEKRVWVSVLGAEIKFLLTLSGTNDYLQERSTYIYIYKPFSLWPLLSTCAERRCNLYTLYRIRAKNHTGPLWHTYKETLWAVFLSFWYSSMETSNDIYALSFHVKKQTCTYSDRLLVNSNDVEE